MGVRLGERLVCGQAWSEMSKTISDAEQEAIPVP
jgi:hypothetical protein